MACSNPVFQTGSLAGRPLQQQDALAALDELFTHSDGVSDRFLEELQATGVRLPAPPLRVVTITPGAGEAEFSMAEARHFACETAQTLPALLTCDGVFFYLNSRITGAVSVPDREALQNLYAGLKAFCQRYPPERQPHAAISNHLEALRLISHGCEENQEAHLYERFLTEPIDVLVQPRDSWLYGPDAMPEKEDDDVFFGRMSQRICNAITVEDRNLLHSTLDEVLNFMVNRFPRVSGIHMRAIHFCKPLEMALVEADLIDRLFIQQFRLVQRVIETENEAALRARFHQELDAIADHAAERRQLQHAELMRQVLEYINENFSDCMLSLPDIAQKFHTTPAKLSGQFREYYQESIPDAIHRRRIEQLKIWLRTTDKTVRELSVNAGYVSVATMNRAFLRLEGLYPGQYRRKMREKPDEADDREDGS